MFKSTITKQSEKDIKKKGNKEVKTTTFNKTAVVSVTLTLLFVAYSAAMIYVGIQYNQGITDRVHAEVKALTATAVPPSKQ